MCRSNHVVYAASLNNSKINGLNASKPSVEFNNFQIQLIDTAGLKSSLITAQDKIINGHSLDLIKQLDIILFVIDGRDGVTIEDKEIFQICRKLNKLILVIVNKVETKTVEKKILEEDTNFFGLAKIFYVSSEHKIGIENVINALLEICQENELNFIKEDDLGNKKKPINIYKRLITE